MSSEAEAKYVTLTLTQKYALKYYISIINQSIVVWLLATLQRPQLSLAFISFCNTVGCYIPLKADIQREKIINKLQNSNKYLLGPLISNCISTPVIMLYIWIHYDQLPLNTVSDLILTMVSLAFIVATSIDAAHELLHRPEPICKFFSYLNLFFLQFTIYPTEHLYLHHKKVGTSQDPITCPKSVTVYKYYVNALLSCYKFNFNYSKQVFMMNASCTLLFNLLLVALAFREGNDMNKVLFFSLWSYSALFIMEMVQYIEHYGLIYRTNDKVKPVTEISSWNSPENEFLNWFIFRFQRHSDHHMNAYKIYPTLDLNEKMPQFPFDFVSGMILCLVSPLWYSIMNPLVDQIILGKSVEKSHHKFVDNCVKILRFILMIGFPLRVIQYLVQ